MKMLATSETDRIRLAAMVSERGVCVHEKQRE